jgi:MFS family permease
MFTLIFALSSAMGPLIGGVLVARWGWPAVFWFRAPVALTSLLFLRGLQPSATATGERFDIAGALLLALGLTLLLLGINAGARLGAGIEMAALLGASLLTMALFAWWEGRAARPMIRIGLFRDPGFALINAVYMLMNLAAFSVLLFVPYFFARFSAMPLWLAGIVLASGSSAMALTSPLAGRLIARVAAEKVGALGILTVGGGLFLIGLWPSDILPGTMALILTVQGIGVGLFQVAYTDIVIRSSPLADRGVAGSLSILTRTMGTVTGAALLTLIFNRAAHGAVTEPAVFLGAFATVFKIAGVAVALSVVAIPWWRPAR